MIRSFSDLECIFFRVLSSLKLYTSLYFKLFFFIGLQRSVYDVVAILQRAMLYTQRATQTSAAKSNFIVQAEYNLIKLTY